MTNPLFMRDVSLTIALVSAGTHVEYNCDVHLAEVITTPGDDVTYQTLCPEGSFSNVGRSSYGLHIVAAQDWGSAGLASFLWDNEGALATFRYQAHGDGLVPSAEQPGMSGEIRLIAPSYGGEADTYAELDITMPCTTKPTKNVAAWPAVLEASADEIVAAEAFAAGEASAASA